MHDRAYSSAASCSPFLNTHALTSSNRPVYTSTRSLVEDDDAASAATETAPRKRRTPPARAKSPAPKPPPPRTPSKRTASDPESSATDLGALAASLEALKKKNAKVFDQSLGRLKKIVSEDARREQQEAEAAEKQQARAAAEAAKAAKRAGRSKAVEERTEARSGGAESEGQRLARRMRGTHQEVRQNGQ